MPDREALSDRKTAADIDAALGKAKTPEEWIATAASREGRTDG